jgi:hypothetical protein
MNHVLILVIFFFVVVIIITNMQSLASLHRSPKKTAAKFVLMNQY